MRPRVPTATRMHSRASNLRMLSTVEFGRGVWGRTLLADGVKLVSGLREGHAHSFDKFLFLSPALGQ